MKKVLGLEVSHREFSGVILIAVELEPARELRGATKAIEEALTHTDPARFARRVIVNGSVGTVVAPEQLRVEICWTVKTSLTSPNSGWLLTVIRLNVCQNSCHAAGVVPLEEQRMEALCV